MKKETEIKIMNGPIKTPWERVVVEGGEVGSGGSWRFIIVIAERLAIKNNKKYEPKGKNPQERVVVGGWTQSTHRSHRTRIIIEKAKEQLKKNTNPKKNTSGEGLSCLVNQYFFM